MADRNPSAARRYGAAVLATAACLLLRLPLWPLLGRQFPLTTFFLGVLVAAWYGGLGPGLVAIGLSLLASVFFLFGSPEDRSPGSAVAGMVLFVVVGVAASLLQEESLRSRRRLEAAGRRLRQREEELRRSEDFLQAVVDNTSASIHVKDLQGRYLLFNRRAERLMGLSRGQVLGRTDHDLFPAAAADAFRANDRLVLESGVPQEFEEAGVGTDGPFVGIALKFPLRDRSGALYAVCGITTFITERKRAEEEAREQGERLAEADRRKDEFLAMLAHELRNPLAPMRNAAQVLRLRGGDPAMVRWAWEVVERQTAHMARLVEELLDAARISGGKVRLRTERLDLAALVRQTAEDHRAGLEALGLALEVETPARAVWASGDPVRLTQVLGNLLHNAAKFTDRGGRVTVRLTEEGSRAVAAVRDTGVGVDPALLPRLFEMFAQADRSLERSKGGLGLGLALVKALVDLHGGGAGAASDGPGKGAEFHFWLPTRAEDAPAPAATAPPATKARRRVLVIEDNRDAAESLRLFLSLAGHEVEAVFSGPAGVEAARRLRPDVVLCDLGLPGLSGFEVARALRADPATASARLIAVSGYSHDDDRRKAREAGFDGALVKPVEPAAFERALAGEPLSWDGAGG